MQVNNTWINTLKSENRLVLTVNVLTALLLNIQQSNSVNRDHRIKHIGFVIILFSRRQPFWLRSAKTCWSTNKLLGYLLSDVTMIECMRIL